MARKAQRPRPPQAGPPCRRPRHRSRQGSSRAFMALLAEKRFEGIGFGEIAERAGRDARANCAPSSLDARDLRRARQGARPKVLAGGDADMAEEPPRERLFDVLMRRIEVMAPYKEAMRSLMRSARAQSRHSPCAQRLGGALAALDADRRRHRRGRAARARCARKGWRRCSPACCAPGSTTTTDHARSMAALDRALARGQRWSGCWTISALPSAELPLPPAAPLA